MSRITSRLESADGPDLQRRLSGRQRLCSLRML